MPLILKVLSYKDRSPEKLLSASFDQRGGTLGRSMNNHFALHDEEKVVSGKHAEIRFESGSYFITDTSTNGTYISNRNIKLQRETAALYNGDRLQIGDYMLLVNIDTTNVSILEKLNGKEVSPVSKPPVDTPITDLPEIVPKDIKHQNEQFAIPALTIEDFFNDDDAADMPIANREPHIQESVNDVPEAIETETDAGLTNGVSITPEAEMAGTDAKVADEVLRHEFIDALKIEDKSHFESEDLQELIRTAGSVLRALIDGVMTILKGRSVMKAEFRVPMTVLQRTGNNPLKFSKDAEEAIKIMLTKQLPGFVDPTDAVQEGIDNIKNHQMAIIEGVTASLKNVIQKFDPKIIAQQHQSGMVLKNAKRWEAYCKAYDKMAHDAIENFFGEEFSRAYEYQMTQSQLNYNNRLDSNKEIEDV